MGCFLPLEGVFGIFRTVEFTNSFNFSIGSVFLAVLVSAGALAAVTKMTGVSLLVSSKGFFGRGGNNSNIKVSNERKGDTK